MPRRTIREKEIIDSFTNRYRTVQSERRKSEKQRFVNRLAAFILGAYLLLLAVYFIVSVYSGCVIPPTVNVIEKIGTTIVAAVVGFYFGKKDA